MKTHTKIAVAFLAAASSITAQAADTPSAFTTTGNVAFTSDYVFRGISQTGGHTALQGGFDVAHTSGLSAGVWASTSAGPLRPPLKSTSTPTTASA